MTTNNAPNTPHSRRQGAAAAHYEGLLTEARRQEHYQRMLEEAQQDAALLEDVEL